MTKNKNRDNRRLSLWITILILLIVLLFIGHMAFMSNLDTNENKDTINIGAMFALTGYGAEWGSDELKGAMLAIDKTNSNGGINGQKIRLITEDSKTDSIEAVKAMNKLLYVDEVKYFLGTTWEADSTAIAPIAKKNNIIMISPSSYKGIEDENSSNLFSTYPPYGYEIANMKNFFKKEELKNFVLIYNNEFFSEVMKEIFIEESSENDWTVLQTYGLDVDEKNYETILLKIKDLGNIDAIYAPLSNEPNKGLLMRQLKRLNMSLKVISTSSTQNNDLLNEYKDELEGLYYAFPQEVPKYLQFEDDFERKYGIKPTSPSAATSYDATMLLIDALKSGARTTQEVSEYLHKVENYEGASNVITFNSNGIISNKKYIVKTIEGGNFVEVQY